jgi:hypothetical protein
MELHETAWNCMKRKKSMKKRHQHYDDDNNNNNSCGLFFTMPFANHGGAQRTSQSRNSTMAMHGNILNNNNDTGEYCQRFCIENSIVM